MAFSEVDYRGACRCQAIGCASGIGRAPNAQRHTSAAPAVQGPVAVQGPAAVQGAASSSLLGNLPATRALPTTTMARREVIAFEFWAEERGLVLHETCSEDEDARNSQPLAGLASFWRTRGLSAPGAMKGTRSGLTSPVAGCDALRRMGRRCPQENTQPPSPLRSLLLPQTL